MREGDGETAATTRDQKKSDADTALDLLHQISVILNTGLDPQTLAILVSLCEAGVNPEALAMLVKDLRSDRSEQNDPFQI